MWYWYITVVVPDDDKDDGAGNNENICVGAILINPFLPCWSLET